MSFEYPNSSVIFPAALANALEKAAREPVSSATTSDNSYATYASLCLALCGREIFDTMRTYIEDILYWKIEEDFYARLWHLIYDHSERTQQRRIPIEDLRCPPLEVVRSLWTGDCDEKRRLGLPTARLRTPPPTDIHETLGENSIDERATASDNGTPRSCRKRKRRSERVHNPSLRIAPTSTSLGKGDGRAQNKRQPPSSGTRSKTTAGVRKRTARSKK